MARQMKDSGVEWIGHIPEDWSIRMLFQIFSEVKNKNEGLIENNLLSLSYGKIKRKNIDSPFGLLPESFEGYNIIEKDDIVLRLTDLQNDQKSLRTGLAREKGIVTSAYTTLRLRTAAASPTFLHHCLHVFDVCKGFYGMGAGVRQGLNWSGIRKLAIPWCEEEEQRVISEYLDTKCAEIDKVVEQTRATIEEYKKLKQAIITEAVTKGVRGPRPMKPSGVEWIGDIPEEWHRSRVGLHYHVVLGKMLCNTQQADDYTLEPYYCAADIHFGSVDAAKKEMWFSPEEKDTYRVMPGDLLVVEGGAGAGGCAIVKASVTATYIQNSIMIVRGKSTCSVAYLGYWIESLVKRAYIDVVCNKATIPHFTKDKLSSVPIPLPSAEEQQEIATYLDTKCAEIDLIIEKKEQLIEELGSYKKSLIYEYVTGKKQVLYK